MAHEHDGDKKELFEPGEVEAMIRGRFADTGRLANSPMENLDSFVGAPIRTGVSELQKGHWNAETLSKILYSIGKDPQAAPSAAQIAEQTGLSNPYAKQAIGFAVDLPTQIAAGIRAPGGVAGTVQKVAMPIEPVLADQALKVAGRGMVINGSGMKAAQDLAAQKYAEMASKALKSSVGSKFGKVILK